MLILSSLKLRYSSNLSKSRLGQVSAFACQLGTIALEHETRLPETRLPLDGTAQMSYRFSFGETITFNEVNPSFSPDGRWLAYASNESATMEVFVRPFPGPGGRGQLSTGVGGWPLWSRNGRELLFQTLDRHVMAVSCTTGAIRSRRGSLGFGRRLACVVLTSFPTTILRRTESASRRSSPTMQTPKSPPTSPSC